MNIEKLKEVAHEKRIILTQEKLPKDVKFILRMRLNAILSNHSSAFLSDLLFQYLRTVCDLYDNKKITKEQFEKLMIDYDTLKAILL